MKTRKILSVLLALILCISVFSADTMVLAKEVNDFANTELTEFEKAFASPEGNDVKPYVRWWISPGRMEEEITRQEIRNFKAGGFGGVELVCLELASCEMNSYEWNETFFWIFDEAYKQGLKVDVMLTEFWPLSTHRIPNTDERFDEKYSTQTSQTMYVGNEVFTAEPGSMTYSNDGYVYPETASGFKKDQYFKLLAVTAAKRVSVDGANAVYDPASIIDLTESVDPDTGSVNFVAPSEGAWGIFYAYQQATGQVLGFGVDTVTIDHLSKDGSKLLADDFDEGIAAFDEAYDFEEGQLTLAKLYKEVGGNFFADSLELDTKILWSSAFLDEFKARRGYDLTPYLPAIYDRNTYNNADRTMPYEMQDIGLQVRLDYGLTVSELLAENHIKYLRDWAQGTYDMGIRYQVHSSKGSIYFDQTLGCIEADIPETESYALGNNLDQYRKMSGITHMKNSLYTAEACETNNSSWRQTWTGSLNKDNVKTSDRGFLYYANRLFAAGVNKIVFHGTSAKLTDFSNQADLGPWIPPATPSWPGYSLMGGMNYGNEWDDKTPMWEHVNEMTDFLNRTQMVLQQGQGDIDLAFYKVYTTMSASQAEPWEVNNAGYTFDYVSDAVLNMDGAVVGIKDGQTVLAPDGPSYKALVIDQFRSGSTVKPYTMTLETANKILEYAIAGLPVVIVGDAPSKVGSYPGNDSDVGSKLGLKNNNKNLVRTMNELKALPNVIQIDDRTELVDVLKNNGIMPDANPNVASTNMFYHRKSDNADFYFIANDSSTTAASQTVTFKGEGRPYLLNAWSGEIIPIAQYIANDGTVTFDIELDPEEQMLVAIAKDGLISQPPATYVTNTNADEAVYEKDTLAIRTKDADQYYVTLNDGSSHVVSVEAAEAPINLNASHEWKMVLNKWEPLDPSNPDDPTDNNFLKVNKVDSETFTLTELVPWYSIDDSLARAAGVATYTTSFNLEKGWEEGQGALLAFTNVSDVMKVFINGNELFPNQISKSVDIGEHLVAGKNDLVVKVSSNLANYKFGTRNNNTFQFGIIGDVTVIPYMQTTFTTKMDSASVSLYLPKAIVEINEQVDAVLKVEDAVDLYGANFKISYDTEHFEVEEVVADQGLGNDVSLMYSDKDGLLNIVLTLLGDVEAINGDADLIRISLKAKDIDAATDIKVLEDSSFSNIHSNMAHLREEVVERIAIANSDITGGGPAINDLVLVAKAFGCVEGDPGYEVAYDMNKDGEIDIIDIAYVAFKVLGK